VAVVVAEVVMDIVEVSKDVSTILAVEVVLVKRVKD
jgi:hypothetical protein